MKSFQDFLTEADHPNYGQYPGVQYDQKPAQVLRLHNNVEILYYGGKPGLRGQIVDIKGDIVSIRLFDEPVR